MAAANPAKLPNDRRALAEELLGLHRKHGDVFARMEDLKRALRESATAAGENFKEEFAGEGVVKVAGRKDGKFKGIVPTIDQRAFIALSEAKRNKLIESGVITMVNEFTQPFYGSVTVEVF